MSSKLPYRVPCLSLVLLFAACIPWYELPAQFPMARHYDNLDYSPSSDAFAGIEATPDGGYIICGSSGAGAGCIEPIIVKCDAGGKIQWQHWINGLPDPICARLLDIISYSAGSLLPNPFGGPDAHYIAVGYRLDLDEYFLVGLDIVGDLIFLENSNDFYYPNCNSFALNKIRPAVFSAGAPADDWAAVGSYYKPNQGPVGDFRISRILSSTGTFSIVEYDNPDRNDFGTSLTVTSGNIYICGDTYPVSQPSWNEGYVICAPPDASAPVWANRYFANDPVYFLDIIASHDEWGIPDGLLITGYTGPSGGPFDLIVVKIDYAGTLIWARQIDDGANEFGRSIRQFDNGDILVAGVRRDMPRYEGYVVHLTANGALSSWRVFDPAPLQDYTSFFDVELVEPDEFNIIGSTADFGADYYDGYFSKGRTGAGSCYYTAGNASDVDLPLNWELLLPQVIAAPELSHENGEVLALNLSEDKRCEDPCTPEVQNGQNTFQWSYGSRVDFGLEGLQDPAGDFALVGYSYSPHLQHNDVFLVKTDSDGDSETPGNFRRRIYIDDPEYDWWEYGHSIELSMRQHEFPELSYTYSDGYLIAGSVESYTEPHHILDDRDAYYMKVDLNGDVLWSRRLGKAKSPSRHYFDEARSIRAITKKLHNNHVFNAGYIIGGFVNGEEKGYYYDALVMRTDINGLVPPGSSAWSKCYSIPYFTQPHGKTNRELAHHVETIDADGDLEHDDGIIVAGTFEYHKDIRQDLGHPDPVFPVDKLNMENEFETCTFLLIFRLSMEGDVEWCKVYGTWFNNKLNGEQQSYHVLPTDDDGDGIADDGFIAVGAIYRVIDNTYLSWDALAVKIDSEGELQWHRVLRFGNGDDALRDWARGVVQTDDGGFVITGGTEFRYESAPNDYHEQGFLLKLDCDGEIQWCRELPTDLTPSAHVAIANGDLGNYVQQTQDGGLMMVGGTCTFNAWHGFDDDGDLWFTKTRCDGETCLSRDLDVIATEVDFRSEDKTLDVEDYETPVAVVSTSATVPCDPDFRNCQFQACYSAAPAGIIVNNDVEDDPERSRDPLENVPHSRRAIREGAPFISYSSDVTGAGRESLERQSVIAYPNPAPTGCELHLQIELGEAQEFDFFLYDALGKVLLQRRLRARAGYNAIPLQLPKLAAGAYHFALIRNGVTLSSQALNVVK